ncbi:hypothetical protein C3E98_014130 [Pseudomonas sp. MWU13-2625]|nr:hypothetical protein C3E97_007600 [Pseudomonas sp. MWU12-2115]RBL70979.1 hypothetical protein C3E98_014130 [Pseudomonas sp. MWU13-2625]
MITSTVSPIKAAVHTVHTITYIREIKAKAASMHEKPGCMVPNYPAYLQLISSMTEQSWNRIG